MEKSYVYRSVEGLKVALIVLLTLDLVLNVLSAGSSWMQLQLLQRPFTEEEGNLNDLREGAVGLAQLSVFIVTVIVFGVWIVRAHKNVRAFGYYPEISPGWAVGWFCIPFANFWKPYQAMKQLCSPACLTAPMRRCCPSGGPSGCSPTSWAGASPEHSGIPGCWNNC